MTNKTSSIGRQGHEGTNPTPTKNNEIETPMCEHLQSTGVTAPTNYSPPNRPVGHVVVEYPFCPKVGHIRHDGLRAGVIAGRYRRPAYDMPAFEILWQDLHVAGEVLGVRMGDEEMVHPATKMLSFRRRFHPAPPSRVLDD